MRTIKNTRLQQALAALKNGTKRYGAVAASIPALIGMVGEAKATLLPTIPPNQMQAPLDVDAAPLPNPFVKNGGTIGDLTSSFDVMNAGTHIVGTIRSIVMQRNANLTQGNEVTATPGAPIVAHTDTAYLSGGLDFYYQVTLDSALSSANADIRALTLSIFDPSSQTGTGAISAFDILTAGNVPNPGLAQPATALGDLLGQALLTNRDSAGVKFDFRAPGADNTLTVDPLRNQSNWLVLRTHSTTFGGGNGALIDGIAFNAPILAPGIPEPSAVLFGIGLCFVSALRRRKAVSAPAV